MKFLNQSIQIGALKLSSRLVMAPMETRKANHDMVSQELCDYYDEKSKGGYLGLVVTEHCYISPEGQASKNQLSIAKDDCIAGLGRMAEAIHQNSVPVILQISHAGSKAKSDLTGLNTISASPVHVPGMEDSLKTLPAEMKQKEIERVINCFVEAAIRAKKSGYDGVEIHSAHGYLLNQFYSPLTNKRTDEYTGNSIDGRTRLHIQIIRGIREAAGKDFLISIRLGACDYIKGGSEKEEAVTAGKIFQAAGADMISVTGGMCDYTRPGHSEQGWFAELSECIKKEVSIPVLLTGGITEAKAADELLEMHKADLIGVGRGILKDSGLPKQFME